MHTLTFSQALRASNSQRSLALGRWLATLLLLLTGPAAFAQLSGAYTINSGQPTGGTNYATFTAAAAALNASGVSGPVTFTVSGGPYTEQIILNQLTGSSATNRVTINGGGRTIQFGSSTSAQRGVITLNGADYVTINNLVVDATEGGTSTATYGWGIHVLNNSDNCTISNCTVLTNTAATTTNFAGIVSSASTTSATTSGTTASQNLTLTGNTVTGGYYGITALGSGTTASPTPGIVISNNTVRDFYFYGIYTSYLGGAQVVGNDVARPTRGTVSTFYGIYLTTGVSGTAVERNRIHNPFGGNATSTSSAYGIYLTTGTAATTTNNPNEVINNLVYDMNGAGDQYGLYNGSSGNSRFYYNSVSLDDQTNTSANDTYGFYQTTGLGVEFKNNAVSVTRTGNGLSYAIDFTSATGTVVSNYNALYGSGANFNTGRYVTTDYRTLANWRTANNNAYDQNSVDASPQYVNAAAGNLRPSASALNGAATPLARVTTDFTGAARSATAPDMGAYEFSPATDDVALESIDSPTSPVLAGARPVTVTVRNNGASPLTSVRLEYMLNGGAPVVQNFTGLSLASGATQQFTFSTQATLVVGPNTLTVTASLPNGNTDANPANNSRSTTVYTAMAGAYTINKNLPTGGSNFASFTDAATALNAAGITASVRFTVLNGPYNEQFALGIVPGVSATDTIVVDGGASRQTLSYTGTAAQPAAVLLNGTDYVTLLNLTIDASAGTTYGIGVHLVGQANNNRVRNCVVRGPAAATSSTADAAIAASGGVASASSAGDANNLRIENNVLSGGYYCVILTGASTTARSTGVRVVGNEIRDFYVYGLDVESSSGARLLDNNIHRTSRSDVSTFYGVYLVGCVGAAVERNRIHDSFTGNTSDTAGGYGIYTSASDATAGTENDFVNNVVYNFNGAGTEYGIYNTSSDYARYFHNTISLDNQAFTGTTLSYGFYQTTLATGIDFRNNMVSVTRTGTGNRFALYFVTTTSTITSNYNNLYIGTGANYFTGRWGTANFASLTDWRAANANAFDQNSSQVNPRFVDAATGNLQPSNIVLNGTGTPALLARVPRDIANVLRSSPPDMGAFEFSPIADDAAVVSIDSPTSPATPGLNTVRVTIRNGGTAVLTAVTLRYVLNSGTPVVQTFTGLNLASGATQQLTFTQGLLALSGTNTLTVTASLPNGNPDGNASNDSQTITFTQPTPANDEPCTAVTLTNGTVTASSNSGASTSAQAGIVTPSCAGGALPKDVWFAFTPSGTSTTLTLTGNAAGTVRIFSSSDCANGPFSQVFCQGSGASNTPVGTVTVTGLVPSQRYYVAVSGFNSSDPTGAFTIGATALLGTRATASTALAVFPNPSATGQLTLRLATGLGSTGTVALVNALGQVVQQQPLTAAAEQLVPTRGLAAGVYTLRVQAGAEVMTRKVVLQ